MPTAIMALPTDVRERYIVIIDSILADADLSTIGPKRICKGIQKRVEYDITPQRVCHGVEGRIPSLTGLGCN